jgi:DNA-binding NarL/FixJ family response regulator
MREEGFAGTTRDRALGVAGGSQDRARGPAGIVIIDDHFEALARLRALVEQEPDLAVVARCRSADEAILPFPQSPPELMVFLKGRPAAMLVSLLSKALGGEPSGAADSARRQFPSGVFRDGAEALSEREREVAKLAAAGARNKEIAWQLGISEGTVKLHLFRAYRKLRVTNRVGLALALGGSSKKSEPGSKP